jgi:hypothetical protein
MAQYRRFLEKEKSYEMLKKKLLGFYHRRKG